MAPRYEWNDSLTPLQMPASHLVESTPTFSLNNSSQIQSRRIMFALHGMSGASESQRWCRESLYYQECSAESSRHLSILDVSIHIDSVEKCCEKLLFHIYFLLLFMNFSRLSIFISSCVKLNRNGRFTSFLFYLMTFWKNKKSYLESNTTD